MNQNIKMSVFTVINTINSAGVWQEGNFMELNVVMSQCEGGKETNFRLKPRTLALHETGYEGLLLVH